MSSIYSLDAQKNLFLYTTDSLICLRNASGEALERAIILCNDYASDMTDTILDKTLYYAYQNQKQDLIVRSITDLNILYKLSSQDTPDCSKPYLTVLNNQLILFYLVKNPLDDSYCIKSICPFATENSVLLPQSFLTQPTLHCIPLKTGLLLVAETAQQQCILLVHNNGTVESLCSFENQLNARIEELQKEHASKLSAMENEYAAHLAQVEAGLTSQLSSLKSELYKRNKMIESAKLQYNELMDTATKYRDEAIKWRSKFYRED